MNKILFADSELRIQSSANNGKQRNKSKPMKHHMVTSNIDGNEKNAIYLFLQITDFASKELPQTSDKS